MSELLLRHGHTTVYSQRCLGGWTASDNNPDSRGVVRPRTTTTRYGGLIHQLAFPEDGYHWVCLRLRCPRCGLRGAPIWQTHGKSMLACCLSS